MKKYFLLFIEEITFLYFMHWICIKYPERFTGDEKIFAFYMILEGTICFSWLICRIMSCSRLQKINCWLVQILTLVAIYVADFSLLFVLSHYFGYSACIKTLLLVTMMMSVAYRFIDISVMNWHHIFKPLEIDEESNGIKFQKVRLLEDEEGDFDNYGFR